MNRRQALELLLMINSVSDMVEGIAKEKLEEIEKLLNFHLLEDEY